MRTLTLSLLLLGAHQGAASTAIMFAPENLNEGCALSWQMTQADDRTILNFKDFHLQLLSRPAAEAKHCRIAWKPLIAAGCYAPSARMVLRGRLHVSPGQATAVRAQIRLSHDLLGQGDTSPITSMDLKEGSFQTSVELPPERFQKRWNEVKLVSHMSLYLRQIKQNPDPFSRRSEPTVARLSIDTLEMETLQAQDCPDREPRPSNPD
jgi:hypothetical protein